MLDVEILHESEPISLRGHHLLGKSNADVNDVSFLSSKVRYIPKAIFDIFPNVRFVNAKASRTHNLRRTWMQKCGNIYGMNFDHNRMTNLSANIFKPAAKLVTISLRNNALTYIDEMAFDGLFNLLVLHLQKNYIYEFFPNTFKDLINLKEFYAYGNRISFLPKGLFDRNVMLEHLSLDKNMLRVIDPQITINLVHLEVLDLRFNACVDKDFFDARHKFKEIEEALKNCIDENTWETNNGTWDLVTNNKNLGKLKLELNECMLNTKNNKKCPEATVNLKIKKCESDSNKREKNCRKLVKFCKDDRDKIRKNFNDLKRNCTIEKDLDCRQDLGNCLTECSAKEDKFKMQCLEYILDLSQDYATYKHLARLNVTMYEQKMKSCATKRKKQMRRTFIPCSSNSIAPICQSLGTEYEKCESNMDLMDGLLDGVNLLYPGVVNQMDVIINKSCKGFSNIFDGAMCNRLN